jgi:TonB family protein
MFRLMILVLAVAVQLPSSFTPARVQSSPFGNFPYGSRAAGVVVLDVTVDERGQVTGIETLEDVDPFGDVLRSAVSSWTFEPARYEGEPVEHPILVAGLFRPAAVLFAAPPALPDPPRVAPHSIPIPKEIGIPPYPPNRIGAAAVLVEVEVNDRGSVDSATIVGAATGFDDASLDAARRWTFRPAEYQNRRVASQAYLLFIFRQPAT